jgi:hypothetical protein
VLRSVSTYRKVSWLILLLLQLPSMAFADALEAPSANVSDPLSLSPFVQEPVIVVYNSNEYRRITKAAFLTLILQNAAKSQTVHYGELHGKKSAERLVIALLEQHRKQGFTYFAMELDTHEQPLVDDFLFGRIGAEALEQILDEISSYVRKSGCGHYDIKGALSIVRAAHDLGYRVVLFDERPKGCTAPGDSTYAECGEPRNRAQFENLRRLIFDKDPDARVVIFSGLDHIDERPNYTFNCGKADQKKLGYFLEEYTGGRNLSVSLGSDVYRQLFKDFMRIRKPGVYPAQIDLEFSIR